MLSFFSPAVEHFEQPVEFPLAKIEALSVD